MSPRRVVRRRYLPLYVMSVVVLCALLLSAWALRERSDRLDQLIFEQCVANEQQDAIIVAQLRAAKRRAVASLPPGQLRAGQLRVLEDGIQALEPPDEQECQPTKGSQP